MARRSPDTRTPDLFAWHPAKPEGEGDPATTTAWQPPAFHVLDPSAIEIRPYFGQVFDTWDLGGNIGLVADTATGKTYLAYALADSILGQGKRILFCAPTLILSEQHAALARTLYRVAADEVQLVRARTSPKRRMGSWTGRVCIATPQLAANDLARGVCTLDGVGLVILDEAHHAARTHASIAVANAAHAHGIRILALTASPGGTTGRIERIRANLHLDRWVRIPETDTQAFRPPTATDALVVSIAPEIAPTVVELESLLGRVTNALAARGYLERASRSPSPADLKTAGDRIRTDRAFELFPNVAAAQQIATVLTLLVSDGYATALASLRRALGKTHARGAPTKTARRLRATPEVQRARERLEALTASNAVHPKQEELRGVVQRAIARAGEHAPRMLVFDRYAEGAVQLVAYLRATLGVRVEVALGHARMRSPLLVQTLHAFERGEFPVLVGTDVIREGIHVPSIDQLVVYSPPRNERELIQLFGRVGRTRPGTITTITAAHEYDRRYAHSAAARSHRMRAALDATRAAAPAHGTQRATHRSMFTRHRRKPEEGFVCALRERFVFERFRIFETRVAEARRGGRPYLTMLVGDRTGTITLRHWCPKGRAQAEALVREFPSGTIAIVSGVYEFGATPCIVVNPQERQGITRCPEGDYDPADYDRTPPF